MKKIYTLTTSLMNGTVTMQHLTSSFATRELAEKAMAAVEEANKNVAPFTVWNNITESELFETESEVPILNQNNENNK